MFDEYPISTTTEMTLTVSLNLTHQLQIPPRHPNRLLNHTPRHSEICPWVRRPLRAPTIPIAASRPVTEPPLCTPGAVHCRSPRRRGGACQTHEPAPARHPS